MIDYVKKEITVGDRMEGFDKFEVWYMGPTGLIPKLDLAIEMFQTFARIHQDENVQFYHMFRPVPVVLGTGGLYEVMPQ